MPVTSNGLERAISSRVFVAFCVAIVRVETYVAASPEVCFDMARDIGLHERTCLNTREKAVAGRMQGLIELDETVTFEATHLCVRQRLTSKIVEFERPRRFVDEMQRGAFKRMRHLHLFEPEDGGTRMVDVLDFQSPLGPIGWLVDTLFLAGYMRRFVKRRNAELKREIERSATVRGNAS